MVSWLQKKLLEQKLLDARGKPCILCKKKSNAVGVCFPESQELISKIRTPKGKARLLVYAICSRCQKKDKNWMNKVEDEFVKQFLNMDSNQQN